MGRIVSEKVLQLARVLQAIYEFFTYEDLRISDTFKLS
jgi:hypothetical protein